MRIIFFPFRFVLCALVALSLWGAPAFSQRLERGVERDMDHSSATDSSNAAETNATEHPDAGSHHNGTVNDWTHHHVIFPRVGRMDRLIKVQNDPRAIQQWEESFRKEYRRWKEHDRVPEGEHRGNRMIMHQDWSIALAPNTATTQISVDNGVYPSKWTFDSNETVNAASCISDYLVVPVDAAGTAAVGLQPNIVGLNNLYSGTGPTGFCNTANGRTSSSSDDGVSATTLFSYAVISDDGVVSTSPTTSFDGSKIAFVEGTTTAAHFHVLAWQTGAAGGVNTANLQDVLTGSVAPTAATGPPSAGQVTDFALLNIDSFSSPFVDYTRDIAYVGDDGGILYRIKNVFCPTWNPCGGSALPSLDLSFGSGTGMVTVCTGFQMTGPVIDPGTENVFVGCADGNLYGFDSTGNPLPGSPLAVGDGVSVNGGIVDAPIVDAVNGWVYVTSGSDALNHMVVVQAGTTSFTTPTPTVATLQPAATTNSGFNMHAPAFNDAYFSGSGTPFLYDYSSDGTPETKFWGIAFSNVPNPMTMTGGIPTHSLVTGLGGSFEVSPVSEFFTPAVVAPPTPAADRVFAGAIGYTGLGNIASWNVTSGFPGGFEHFATYGTGTSGIVVDDTTTGIQANSLYFGVLGVPGTTTNNPVFNLAVKLTQSALN